MENGYIESFNGRLRDECLNAELFSDLLDARTKLEAWRREYNEHRPLTQAEDPATRGVPFEDFSGLRAGLLDQGWRRPG